MEEEDDDEYEQGKATLEVRRIKAHRSPNGTKTIDFDLSAMGVKKRPLASGFEPDSWKQQAAKEQAEQEDLVQRMIDIPPEEPLVMPEDSSNDEDEEDETSATSAENPNGEKFSGEFKWDGFGDVQKLSTENNELAHQLQETRKELARMQVAMKASEPIEGLDPSRFLDVMEGTEMVDQVIYS